MSKLDEYWNKFKKLDEAVDKYKNLELSEFISQCLLYAGFDVNMMNNVYINEICDLPDTYGCYKEGNTIYSYVVNDKGQKQINAYNEDKIKLFMARFVLTAPNMEKHNSKIL